MREGGQISLEGGGVSGAPVGALICWTAPENPFNEHPKSTNELHDHIRVGLTRVPAVDPRARVVHLGPVAKLVPWGLGSKASMKDAKELALVAVRQVVYLSERIVACWVVRPRYGVRP